MDTPRLLPAGDAALVVELGDTIDPAINRRVHALAHTLAAMAVPGVIESVPAYRSLLVHYDPLVLSYAQAREAAAAALGRCADLPPQEPRTVEIPTAYGGEYGPDLAYVASYHGLSVEEVVRLHSGAIYTVYMLGFTPGFPYLGGLPPQLATPRLATPRTVVPAGSVGIAGPQTGIYPLSSPGGWQIIGRTPAVLFDPQRDPPALVQPGERVRFVALDGPLPTPAAFGGTPSPPHLVGRGGGRERGGAGLEVLSPGLLTTVQDLGRHGYRQFGVPAAGAADPWALRAANLLVGNPPDAAALEITLAGPTLQADADCLIAVGGANLSLRVNSWDMPPWAAIFVRRGWTVEFGARRAGCRAVLAVAGGIAVPQVMGSRATYLPGRFGGLEGRALQAGDVLPVGRPAGELFPAAGRALNPAILPPYSDTPTLRVVLGPQDGCFTPRGIATLLSSEYLVSAASNRMGCRLEGPAVEPLGPAEIISDGIPPGAVQVPPDGQPIVMLADGQTTGGYLKIATVIQADLPLLAQCVPGQGRVRFAAVGVEEAQACWRRQAAALLDPASLLAEDGA